eukprot:CAMPEP_0205888390 /NCGR_PEP_ID=MMETSP1083-20121108/20372_1 /ASSEMBLY_ACC=CAM_ASM_000430 /TAXON_ID=97485 /ORGANISM="Prymnesium parvum, Strain Texoma1" /LENGTH=89 /DNA_ID=CAMNT_0053252347 /DNA_START=229 /DNA_END=498 /DNA_ORIENTATION=+
MAPRPSPTTRAAQRDSRPGSNQRSREPSPAPTPDEVCARAPLPLDASPPPLLRAPIVQRTTHNDTTIDRSGSAGREPASGRDPPPPSTL